MKKYSLFFIFLLSLFMGQVVVGASIYIDPGHGGGDSGATGCGLRESDVVLAVSKYTSELLRKAGHTVHMSRTTDVFVTLQGRVSEANAKNVTAFASIHVNAGEGTGIETYCAAWGGKGEQQANKIQAEMLNAWKLANRKVKARGFYVIKYTNMPATLSELAFIDSPGCKDAAYLKSDAHRRAAARAHCRALVQQWGGIIAGCDGGGTPTPPPSEDGFIMGGVFDGPDTKSPRIAGANIKLSNGQSAVSSATEYFKFKVKPGTYSITAEKSGYKVFKKDCDKVEGGKTVWCSVFMTKEDSPTPPPPVPAKAKITGVVYDGTIQDISAVQLSGVNVTLQDGRSVRSGSDGSFMFEVDAGKYSVSAKFSGYKPFGPKDCGEVVAGGTLKCDIFMEKEVGNPPPDRLAVITGFVYDSETENEEALKLDEVKVSLDDGTSVQASASEGFKFEVKAGQYKLTAVKEGWKETQKDCGPVGEGETLKCSIFMARSDSGQPGGNGSNEKGALFGVVRDAKSNTPITAQVQLIHGEERLPVDYNGSSAWRLEELEAGSYRVEARSEGYIGDTKDCTVEAGKANECSLSLVKAEDKDDLDNKQSGNDVDDDFKEFSDSGCSQGVGSRGSLAGFLFLFVFVVLFIGRRFKSVFRFMSLLGLFCIVSFVALPAQSQQGESPFSVEASKFWTLNEGKSLQIDVKEVVLGAGYRQALLSPDGSKVFAWDGDKSLGVILKLKEKELIPLEFSSSRGIRTGRFIGWKDNYRLSYEYFENKSDLALMGYSYDVRHSGVDFRNLLDLQSVSLEKSLEKPLIYVYEEGSQIFLVTPNRGEVLISDPVLDDRYYSVRLSSDYRYVVYTGLHTGVYLYDVEAGCVVYRFEDAYEPVFSADGQKLLINRVKDDGNVFTEGEIYVLDLKTRKIHYLENPSGEIRIFGSLDRDGSRVSYSVADKGIWVVKVK